MEIWFSYLRDGILAVFMVALIVAAFFRTGTRSR